MYHHLASAQTVPLLTTSSGKNPEWNGRTKYLDCNLKDGRMDGLKIEVRPDASKLCS